MRNHTEQNRSDPQAISREIRANRSLAAIITVTIAITSHQLLAQSKTVLTISPPEPYSLGSTCAVSSKWIAAAAGKTVHLFEQRDGAWIHRQKLDPPPERIKTYFGRQLALNGDYCFVNDSTHPHHTDLPPVVHVYRWSGTSWDKVQVITSDIPNVRDRFANTLVTHGEWLAIGAPATRSPQGERMGCVHLFRERDGRWEPAGKLEPPPSERGGFGTDIGLHESTLVVARQPGDLDAINGRRPSFTVFELQDGRWSEGVVIPSTGLGAHPCWETNAVVVSNNWFFAGGFGTEKEYQRVVSAFRRTESGWVQEEFIRAPDGSRFDFGVVLGCSGDRLIAGTPSIRAGDSRLDLFQLKDGHWVFEKELTAIHPEGTRHFTTRTFDISGPIIVIGAAGMISPEVHTGAVVVLDVNGAQNELNP